MPQQKTIPFNVTGEREGVGRSVVYACAGRQLGELGNNNFYKLYARTLTPNY